MFARYRRGIRPEDGGRHVEGDHTMFPKNRRAFTLIEVMIVVLITGILLAMAVPNFTRARESARQKACVGNLKQIYSANQQWAINNRISSTGVAPPAISSLVGYNAYLMFLPICTGGGAYSQPSDVSGNPTCSYGTNGGASFSHDINAL